MRRDGWGEARGDDGRWAAPSAAERLIGGDKWERMGCVAAIDRPQRADPRHTCSVLFLVAVYSCASSPFSPFAFADCPLRAPIHPSVHPSLSGKNKTVGSRYVGNAPSCPSIKVVRRDDKAVHLDSGHVVAVVVVVALPQACNCSTS